MMIDEISETEASSRATDTLQVQTRPTWCAARPDQLRVLQPGSPRRECHPNPTMQHDIPTAATIAVSTSSGEDGNG